MLIAPARRCERQERSYARLGNGESTVNSRIFAPQRAHIASVALAALAILVGATVAQARRKTLVWKPVTQALLKENNHPVKKWNVYRPDRNHDLVLLQVDGAWLIFNLKQKRVYWAERNQFQARGNALAGPVPGNDARVAKTENWESHDVGPAQQVSVRFAATGDVLTIELPHPLAIY